ncbi:GntR family transcriptional regulator [Skermanella stibiiresistens]|uniref:GntR family transcriptional regulator n=1 Tax=Skermanella stibiiresistens TaxID=913326 RepID=UPI0004B8FD3A|nr:GntR family transcriptional regulator [Skermanella stibiiresistens]
MADVLRDLIVSGAVAPGTRLTEVELCRTFNRSRGPIREAIRVLTSEGLTEPLPNRGVRVRQPGIDEILQTFSVIGTLDAMAGEHAAARISDAGISHIGDLHQRMVAAFQGGDIAGYYQLNQAIHHAIWEASENKVLVQELERLNAWVRPYRFAVNIRVDSWRKSVMDHENILIALINRDGRRLGQILRLHLPGKADVLRAQLVVSPTQSE